MDGIQLLEALFEAYYTRLVRFSFQITGNKSSAEDVVQEAFAAYWEQRTNVSAGKKAAKTYLYNTVKNRSLNLIRHEKTVEQYLDKQRPSQLDDTDIVHAMIRAEVVAEIFRAVDTLPEGCRRVVQMGYMDGKKNHEIARELGVSVNTVKTQKKRALQLLRLRLRPELLILLLPVLT